MMFILKSYFYAMDIELKSLESKGTWLVER